MVYLSFNPWANKSDLSVWIDQVWVIIGSKWRQMKAEKMTGPKYLIPHSSFASVTAVVSINSHLCCPSAMIWESGPHEKHPTLEYRTRHSRQHNLESVVIHTPGCKPLGHCAVWHLVATGSRGICIYMCVGVFFCAVTVYLSLYGITPCCDFGCPACCVDFIVTLGCKCVVSQASAEISPPGRGVFFKGSLWRSVWDCLERWLADTNAEKVSRVQKFMRSHAGFGATASELCKSESFVSLKMLLMDSG